MNHIKNIKEMLSIPTGSRTAATTSAYSSFTDSQFFLGSQFWPENSQGTSQDMSLSSRASQQSSTEESEPKFTTSYHSKPLLFREIKDKGKAFGMLDKFEEDRKRVKEKIDSDILAKESHHFQETLNNIHQLVTGTEKNTAVCQTVLEKFDSFSSTLQNNLNSLQSDITQQLGTLLNKVTSQKETMTELEERVQKSGDCAATLASSVHVLRKGLEGLREEQTRERSMLEEALKLLSALVSENSTKPSHESLVDSAIQTSPSLENPLSSVLQDNKLEGKPISNMSDNFEYNQVAPQDRGCVIGKRKFTLKGRRRSKKRPLVLSQRSKLSVTDENRKPLINSNKQQHVSSTVCEFRINNTVISLDSPSLERQVMLKRQTRSVAAECLITPFSCWSQDSNNSVCLGAIEPNLEKLSNESQSESPMIREGLWQLFDF